MIVWAVEQEMFNRFLPLTAFALWILAAMATSGDERGDERGDKRDAERRILKMTKASVMWISRRLSEE